MTCSDGVATIVSGLTVLDTVRAGLVQVFASHAERSTVLSESEGAATLTSPGCELLNLLLAELLRGSSDSHLTGLSARDHLVGSDSPVVTAVLLGFAVSSALVGVLDHHLLGSGFAGLDGLGSNHHLLADEV